MNYQEIFPSIHLQTYIKCFWQLEQNIRTFENTPQPVLPDGCFELIFNLSDKFRRYHLDGTVETQPKTIIVGQMRRAVSIKPTGKILLFGIRFHSNGAFPLFKFPLNQLQDKIENLQAIWGGFGVEFEEKINEAASIYERIHIAEKIIREKIDSDVDKVILNAPKIISANRGQISIEYLANHLGINWKKLERNFQQQVGLSPKVFCRIIRLQNVLQILKNQPKVKLIDVALTFGYYDQAHLIHEFKDFSGQTPLAFIETEKRLTEVFIGTN